MRHPPGHPGTQFRGGGPADPWRRRTRAPAAGGGPRVLVVVASRHGATREIAARLCADMRGSEAGTRAGLTTVLVPAQEYPDPATFDAVVLGSAVYAGRWLVPARDYAEVAAASLRRRPTWLFSSGVGGARVGSPDAPDDPAGIGDSIAVRGHAVFDGRLERRLLSAAERTALPATSPADGDFRDWPAVRAWADEIAAELAARLVPA